MNLLDHYRRNKIHLLARNEGKIKSYESCGDVRAWSHDMRARDRYLREWIRSDMPLCVVPVSTLVGFFRTMTCRRNGRATPRCHPDCKSKVILDSITTSCEAMRQCLKTDENLEKFFIEEELESSHWPCERCLEALKSIKMFWKILLEKVFAVNITKNECFEDSNCSTTDSVRDMARNWGKDMVQQALFVKSISPQLLSSDGNPCKKPCIRKISSCRIPAPSSEGDTCGLSRKGSKTSVPSPKCPKKVSLDISNGHTCRKCCKPSACSSDCSIHKKPRVCSSNCSIHKRACKTRECSPTCNFKKRKDTHNCSSNCSLLKKCCKNRNSPSTSDMLKKCKTHECSSQCTLHTKCNRPHACTSKCNIPKKCCKSHNSSNSNLSKKSIPKATCRCTSVKVKTVDVSCGTSSESPEVKVFRANMDCLQRNYNVQKEEIEKLRKENYSLKCELQNIYRSCKWKAMYCQVAPPCVKDNSALVPKPFESFVEDSCTTSNSAKDADSELVITMKNCKNESFRHVSLLQVLHKTNDPCMQDTNADGPNYKNEDPVQLLNKVQATLGKMVSKEMALACKKRCGSSSEIEASFQRVNGCKSSPSRSTLSSRCTLNSFRSKE